MSKIPVRIVRTQDIHGTKKIGVMLDVSYYLGKKENPDNKVQAFKDLYLDTVMKAREMFYGKGNNEVKKYQDLPSSVYWLLGDILRKFNNKIENEFVITNYAVALERDFEISKGYVNEILNFVKIFKKNEVFDSIPFSYYRLFMRKRSQLVKLGIFEREKKRFLNIRRQDKLPGRENYKKDIENTIRSFPKK